MSDYKRLTKSGARFDIKNFKSTIMHGAKIYMFDPISVNTIISDLNRLAELEDKIEQGTLIELPCKVGDTVCKYYKVENGIKIYSGTVTKIEMRKNGIMIYITNLPNFYYDKAFVGDLSNRFIDTTCYYFCPVKEAEKRLKELNVE